MKVTFKKNKPYKWDTFHIITIKIDGKRIGEIQVDRYRIVIRMTIIKDDINSDGNPNCTWKWIQFKYNPTDEEDAKKWIISNMDVLLTKYTFKYL